MAKISVRPHKCKARPNLIWVVSVGRLDGKRKRFYFETKEEADAAAQVKRVKVQNLGRRASPIDNDRLLEFLDVQKKLAPCGVTLLPLAATLQSGT